MLDWLAIWGVSSAVGFLFQPVMVQFAQDVGKDLLKDVFKDVLKAIPGQILHRLKKEEKDIAVGKAFKEFLELVQQELQGADFSDTQVQEYTKPLKTFLNEKRVQEILGSPFNYECEAIDIRALEKIWYELNLLSLPQDFHWVKLGKLYVKKVKAIILASPKLRDILDSNNLDKIQENTTQIAGVIPTFDLKRYQEGIRECYGNLKLDSLDTSGYAYNELKLWRIFTAQNVRETHQVLAQVHELPKEHLRRLRESGQVEAEVELEDLERHKRVYFEQPIRSVLDVVNKKQDYKYIVILGNPGSGKSTLLQFLALNWAESPLDNVISLPIPLLIELRTYMRRREDKECNNFLEFFHKCSGAIAHLNQLELDKKLKAGNALVMFDGLDEVFDPGKREDVITDIHRFTNDYPDVQVIVTSRIIGYKPQQLRDAEFRHFTLQDLDSEQIQDFIYRWHELTFTDAVDKVRKRERLKIGIETYKWIAKLAGNPLLLTMMAILNVKAKLPIDRSKLYKDVSKLLLHDWDNKRHLKPDARLEIISLKDKQAMLRKLAYKMQTREKSLAGNIINEDDLEELFSTYMQNIGIPLYKARDKASKLKEQLHTRNFMLCSLGADYYAFVHRTFLEYFCAWEFVWQFKETQTLTIEELKNEVFGKHWQDESWHEVLLLIAGMIEPRFVGEILDYLMAQDGKNEKFANIFLAADCLSEIRNRNRINLLDTQLYERIEKLINYTHDDDDYYYIYDSEGNLDDIIYGNEERERDITIDINMKAVAKLGEIWKEHPNTLSTLKELAFNSEDIVKYVAITTLAQNFKDDPSILFWLKNDCMDNRGEINIQAAVEAVAGYFKEDPETLPWLKNKASEDEYDYTQCKAVQALARHFKKDSDTLPFLKQCAKNDGCWTVRCQAIEELEKECKDQPCMFEFFYDITLNDTFQRTKDESRHEYIETNPRQTALEIIIKQFPQHDQTLPLLRDRAENDPDEQVREYAQNKLKQWEG